MEEQAKKFIRLAVDRVKQLDLSPTKYKNALGLMMTILEEELEIADEAEEFEGYPGYG